MIMEGLETLVAPSHHAFLLTESAAAAHFNVLSFDTCLFKTSAQTSPSTASVTSATAYHSPPSAAQQTLLHYNFTANPSTSPSAGTAAIAATGPGSNSVISSPLGNVATSNSNSCSNSNSSSHCNTSSAEAHIVLPPLTPPRPGGHRLGTISVVPETQEHIHGGASNKTNNNNNNNIRNSGTHLSLLNTAQAGAGLPGVQLTGSASSSMSSSATTGMETQSGDLNTPVTTSGDVPSFFGPATLVEPPPITGKFTRHY